MKNQSLTSISSISLLNGVKVVELSRHVAGAYCGKLLAMLGAHVTRFGTDIDITGSADTRAAMQQVVHAGKHCATLEDKAVYAALSQARIVIVERDDRYDALATWVNDIIQRRKGLAADASVVVLSANGEHGNDPPGCGLTSAAHGAMAWGIGEPSREPLTPAYDIVDHEAGASAAAAALVALVAGQGAAASPIDVASRDVIAHFVSMLAQNYLPYGRPWQRDGRRPFMSGGIYPLGLFKCKDGYVALYCRSTTEWKGIVKAMGSPPWSKAERFEDPRIIARKHGDEADTYLLPWLEQHTKTEIMEIGLQYGFPAAPVRFVSEALSDPQFAFRGSLKPQVLDTGKTVLTPVAPWRLHEASAAGSSKPLPLQSASIAPNEFLMGLRVLDMSWVWSGPLTCSILADLGAEVIKVEHSSRLDSVRQRGRPIRDGKEVEGPVHELNPWFNQLNHGKKSVELDIKNESDRETIRQIAATCDIVIENMRPGALAKASLGYEDFAKVNPSVIMLSMSLAGQAGPLSHMKGYAGIMTSMAGLESLVGYVEDDGTQTVVGMAKTALGDPNAANHAFCVLMAALYRRKLTGRGLWIDLSQTDAILSLLAAPLIESQFHGEARVMGNTHSLYAPHGHFRCKGEASWVAISVQTEMHWLALLAAINDATLTRFSALDATARLAQRQAIEKALEAWAVQHSADDIVARLSTARVPVAPVATYQEMSASSWRKTRGLTRTVVHPYVGMQDVVVPPWRFGNQTAGVARPAPLLGADTETVCAELNKSPLLASAGKGLG